MRDGLADEGVGVRHSAVILGCTRAASQRTDAACGQIAAWLR